MSVNIFDSDINCKRKIKNDFLIFFFQSFETGDDHEVVVAGANDKFFKIICEV